VVKREKVPPTPPLQETFITVASLSAKERTITPFRLYGPTGAGSMFLSSTVGRLI